jgi:hypothetical protein
MTLATCQDDSPQSEEGSDERWTIMMKGSTDDLDPESMTGEFDVHQGQTQTYHNAHSFAIPVALLLQSLCPFYSSIPKSNSSAPVRHLAEAPIRKAHSFIPISEQPFLMPANNSILPVRGELHL